MKAAISIANGCFVLITSSAKHSERIQLPNRV